MKLLRTHPASFSVTELARSKQFYGTLLGLAAIERPGMGVGGAWYRAGDIEVHLIVRPAGVETGTPPPICAAPGSRCSKPLARWDNCGCAIRMGT